MKSLAIVGSGVAGLGAAWRLRDKFDITILEAGNYVGGHTNTFDVPLVDGGTQPVDTGFIVFNEQTYPHLLSLFRELGVEYANSDMSFAHYNTLTGLQWSSRGLGGLFAQRKNLLSPRHYRFLAEANRFNTKLPIDLEQGHVSGTFGDYLKRNNFSDYFLQNYIVPMTAAVWSTPPDRMLAFPARTFARFFVNHGFLSLYNGLQWKYVVGGSRTYVKKILAAHRGKVLLNEPVLAVQEVNSKVEVRTRKASYSFDAVLVATHANQALEMLSSPTEEQRRLLSKFKYEQNVAVLHSDERVLQPIRKTWASWNFKLGKNSNDESKSTVVYYMNLLQKIPGNTRYFVSLNDFQTISPEKTYARIEYEHPLFDEHSESAQGNLPRLNESGNIFFSGSYFRYGFHEDAYMSAVSASEAISRRVLS